MKTKPSNVNRLRLAAVMSATCLMLTNAWADPARILNLASNEIIRAIAISPDGAKLAVSGHALISTASNAGTFQSEAGIELFDLAAGKRIGDFHQTAWNELDDTNTGAYEAGALEFSPDGKLLAATDGYGFVLWDVVSGAEKFRWRSGVFDAGLSPGWSADGKWLVLPSMEQARDAMTNGIALIASDTGKRSAFFPVEVGYARMARISLDGRWLATAGQDCTVRVFDLAARTSIFEENTQGNLFALAFSPDSRHLIAGEFLFYDVVSENGKAAILKKGASNQKPGEEVNRLEFTPEGKYAFSTSTLGTVRIWETTSWTTVALATGCSGRLWPDGTKLALWREEKPNALEIWDLPEFVKIYHGNLSPQESRLQKIRQSPPALDPMVAARNECISNLRRIEIAKKLWATDTGKQTTDTPAWSDLQPYFGPNGWLPKCPSGGTYTIGTVGEKPQCNIPGHALP